LHCPQKRLRSSPTISSQFDGHGEATRTFAKGFVNFAIKASASFEPQTRQFVPKRTRSAKTSCKEKIRSKFTADFFLAFPSQN
jgi:hypothetical protein